MRALLPRPMDAMDVADVVAAYAPPASTGPGPFVRCTMISSVDGAVTLHGRSGALGGPADRQVFRVLRSWADVVVVGAGTARTERYGPVRLDAELRAARVARGQPPVPPIAVVTRSGTLDLVPSFFTEAEARPIVVTAAGAGEAAVRRDGHVSVLADLLVAGEGAVDLEEAFGRLAGAGYHSVLLEGGPGLNADVVRTGLLDELCLTVSPRLVAGVGARAVAGPELDPPLSMEVVGLLEADGFLFFRLAVAAGR